MNDVIRDFVKTHGLKPIDEGAVVAGARQSKLLTFPPGIQEFYSLCDGGNVAGDNGSTFNFLGLSDICRARVVIYGADADDYGPAWPIAFCTYSDTDVLAFDGRSNCDDSIYHCWHEGFADSGLVPVVADSLGQLLGYFLKNGVTPFWLSPSGSGGTGGSR